MSALRNPKHEAIALALYAGQSIEDANVAGGYARKASSFVANARKRVQHHGIPERVAELRAAHQPQVVRQAGLGLDRLLATTEALLEFNVDDYLGPADDSGHRSFEIGRVPREKLALLSELGIEPTRYGLKTKIKGNCKIALMRLAADLQGIIKSKQEITGKDGGPIETTEVDLSDNEMLRRVAFLMRNFNAGLAGGSAPSSTPATP